MASKTAAKKAAPAKKAAHPEPRRPLFQLQRVVVENFRSLGDVEIELVDGDGKPRQWTLILGQNGSGKTTLLRAIALLTVGRDAFAELMADPSLWIRNGSEKAVIRGIFKSTEEVRELRIELRRGDSTLDVLQRHKDRFFVAGPNNYPKASAVLGFGVSRRLSSSRSLSQGSVYREGRAKAVATLFFPDATLTPAETWAMDLEYRKGAAGIGHVKRAVELLLPNLTFEAIDKESQQLSLKSERDGKVFASQLSDGYQVTLAWVVDLLYRLDRVYGAKDPFSARGLVLVDEIDLHLHPVWQRELRDRLMKAFPKLQFIGTTHSALTAQQCEAGELFELRQHETGSRKTTLEAYRGEPRKQLIQQILLGPLFGFQTADSKYVETLRLAAQKDPTLKEELESLPSWPTPELIEGSAADLLRSVQDRLKKIEGKK
jgi:energy-coupling factor transporter ATP-binding protein EcfA2